MFKIKLLRNQFRFEKTSLKKFDRKITFFCWPRNAFIITTFIFGCLGSIVSTDDRFAVLRDFAADTIRFWLDWFDLVKETFFVAKASPRSMRTSCDLKAEVCRTVHSFRQNKIPCRTSQACDASRSSQKSNMMIQFTFSNQNTWQPTPLDLMRCY